MKIRLFLIAIWILIAGTEASAHKVIVFAWVEEGMVYTESRFASKRKAQNCPLVVLDEAGSVIHKGTTDEKGEYAFPVPEGVSSDLVIELNAGAGHKGQWKLSRDELILPAKPEDVAAVAEKKEQLEQGPSFIKIAGGLAIIFALAAALKMFKRKKGSDD